EVVLEREAERLLELRSLCLEAGDRAERAEGPAQAGGEVVERDVGPRSGGKRVHELGGVGLATLAALRAGRDPKPVRIGRARGGEPVEVLERRPRERPA